MIEQSKFIYFPLREALEKERNIIEDQGEKHIKGIKDQGEKQIKEPGNRVKKGVLNLDRKTIISLFWKMRYIRIKKLWKWKINSIGIVKTIRSFGREIYNKDLSLDNALE